MVLSAQTLLITTKNDQYMRVWREAPSLCTVHQNVALMQFSGNDDTSQRLQRPGVTLSGELHATSRSSSAAMPSDHLLVRRHR